MSGSSSGDDRIEDERTNEPSSWKGVGDEQKDTESQMELSKVYLSLFRYGMANVGKATTMAPIKFM